MLTGPWPQVRLPGDRNGRQVRDRQGRQGAGRQNWKCWKVIRIEKE